MSKQDDHTHTFELYAVTYAGPSARNFSGVTGGIEVLWAMERATHGFTTFVWKCNDASCCEFRQTWALGGEIAKRQEAEKP
jgi:hypothetical protein